MLWLHLSSRGKKISREFFQYLFGNLALYRYQFTWMTSLQDIFLIEKEKLNTWVLFMLKLWLVYLKKRAMWLWSISYWGNGSRALWRLLWALMEHMREFLEFPYMRFISNQVQYSLGEKWEGPRDYVEKKGDRIPSVVLVEGKRASGLELLLEWNLDLWLLIMESGKPRGSNFFVDS